MKKIYLCIIVASTFYTSLATAKEPSTENTGNPAISMIGTFNGENIRSSNHNSSSFLPLSESEIVFAANIDPHARLDVTITGADGSMAVEEGYITSKLDYGLSAKSGRKFLPVGRVNGLHPHALVYADRPNALVNIFGPEIFVGDGVLLDKPWFVGDSIQTLTASYFSTTNDVAFDPTANAQYAGLTRWTGVWDSSELSTLELGASYVQGKNGLSAQAKTQITDAHLAWKYNDLDAFGVNIESEWLRKTQEQSANTQSKVTDGAYLLLDTVFNRHWRAFARFDYTHDLASTLQADATEKALSVGAVWQISEFQKMTFQYKKTQHALDQVATQYGVASGQDVNALLFRWVVAIGPHGAHAY